MIYIILIHIHQKHIQKNSDLFEKDKVYHIPSYEVLKDLNEPENEKNDLSQSSLSRAKFYGKNFQVIKK